MSSESDNHHDNETSPRKRRRLGSLNHTHAHAEGRRRQHVLRRRQVEAKYNDGYRTLFNDHVTWVTSHLDDSESAQHYSTQIGSTLWSSTEQARFFGALERLGKDDLPGIAKAIQTKTAIETRDLLVLLQDAAAKQGDAKLTLRDIPAATDVGHECGQQLDDAADALAWYQETLEASQEQERYGEHWLITPSIADDIERAMNGVTQSCEPTPDGLDLEPKRHGNGITGACTRCKKRKVKCDRKSPCTQCAKSKAPCVYPESPPVPGKSKIASKEPKNDRDDVEASVGEGAEHHILQAIPEANLLHPGIMLTLSRELFMNRSADSPSPWLHWSHYVSELTTEPSMYRTAFNDFHRLVISLTRRLVQTTIVQATSRLRAQRLRKDKKGLLPFVKLKDVYTAIDVLGMKRNGIERWRGVPRRCGLKVITSKKTPRGKRTREVPWSEVECILGSATPLHEQAASGEVSDNFKSRAMRSGTPLPMHSLALSDSDGDVELGGTTGDSDGSDFSEQSVADEPQSSIRYVFQPRDHIGRYASAPVDRTNVEASTRLDTVEQFDQEASHLGESMLWDILGIQPAANNDLKLGEGSQEIDRDINEKVTTESKNWRQSLDYRAAWEKYRTQVSVSKFAGNQKPLGRMPLSFDTRTSSVTPSSGNLSNTSNNTKAGRDNRKTTTEVELLVRGANAYAALQREDLESSSQGSASTYSSNESMLLEQDIPTESIETR